MRATRSAAIAAVTAAALIVAGAGPATAGEVPLSVTSTGLTDGQYVSGFTRFRPMWTEGADVVKAEIYVNGQRRASRPGRITVDWAVPLLKADDGTEVALTIKAYDAAGNTAEATTTVHADLTFPTANLSPSPGPADAYRGVLSVTATDVSDDVAEIALVASPADGTVLTRATAAPWTLTYNTVGGPRGASIRVTDRAGNERTYYGWRFDNTPPSISDLDDWGDPIRRVRGHTQMHVRFSDTGGSSGVCRSEWRVDGKLIATYSNHSGSVNGSTVVHDFGQTARTATVEVNAWDNAGNQTTRSFSVVVDVAGPTVTSVTPANGVLVRGSQISSTVKATDLAGVFMASLNNGNPVNPPAALTTTTTAGRDGRRVLTWRVFDNLMNVTTVTRWVTVDNTRPSLSVKAPKNNAKVKGTVKISASAGDRNGVSRVELLVNGKVAARDVKAGYSFALNTTKYGKKIRVQLRAYDRAGNVTTTSARIWRR